MKLTYKIINRILLTTILIMLILTYFKIPSKEYFEEEKALSDKLRVVYEDVKPKRFATAKDISEMLKEMEPQSTLGAVWKFIVSTTQIITRYIITRFIFVFMFIYLPLLFIFLFWIGGCKLFNLLKGRE